MKLHTHILLDRSGSMAGRMDEALGAVNGYVETLIKEGTKGRVSVTTFDSNSIDPIRSSVKLEEFEPVTEYEAKPRGGTPLYDAFCKTVRGALARDKKRTVIVVMTDGMENQSNQYTLENVKDMISHCKERDWQIVFLGADFDVSSQNASMGLGMGSSLNSTRGNYAGATHAVAMAAATYGASGEKIEFTDEDRAKASGS